MMVKIESLEFGGPFEAEVKSGSVALGRIELVKTGATYFWQPDSGKWLDVYATPEFKDIEYEITEVADPSKSTTHNEIAEDFPGLKYGPPRPRPPAPLPKPANVNPTALMEIIGNIPAGEWSKISGMANEDIRKNLGPTSELQPVNRAQVIRCLYAFERYAREAGLIDQQPKPGPLTWRFGILTLDI